MPYLDICENHDALALIQSACEKFGMFTDKQAEKAIAARDIQACLDHPTNDKIKKMVSSKVLTPVLL